MSGPQVPPSVGFRSQMMVRPPSTNRVWPTTIDELGATRNSTAPTSSGGCPTLPIGMAASTHDWYARSSISGAVIGVADSVEDTQFTFTPCLIHSAASERVI